MQPSISDPPRFEGKPNWFALGWARLSDGRVIVDSESGAVETTDEDIRAAAFQLLSALEGPVTEVG